jgi:hypothetical protein
MKCVISGEGEEEEADASQTDVHERWKDVFDPMLIDNHE